MLLKETVQFAPVVDNPAVSSFGQQNARDFGYNSLIFTPMIRDDKVIGAIGTAHREPKPFSDKQVALLRAFAAQAVIAIENTRLLSELRESLQQQTATSEVLGVISRSKFELQPILQSVVDTAARLCRAEQAVIFRLEGGVYRFAAGYSIVPAYLEIERRTPISPGPGTLIGRAAMSRQVVRIDDAWTDPLYEKKEDAKIGGHRSMIGVPLMREGEPVGVIGLSRSRVDPFAEREIELVTTFADQAVIAIENVRLFESVEARTRELARSLEELRTAQDRLVQTEKLASLGQLTAGIAHEIKNPLNFVNNFSAVSVELIDELREALGRRCTSTASYAQRSARSPIRCKAISTRSCSTASAPTRSSRTCCCIRVRGLESTGRSISTPWSMRASTSPITGRGPRSRASISPWRGPLTRPPVRSICSRRRLRGCCST